ncbi:leucine-rich repeat protein, putative [Bodo saltans]|uniref:Leucine-rich repeat protein, putative n=1 Tax=Bodo saltans TaxID=75058 RepID=A0A0S4IXM7_BODSA|nr:leucine-rich repeat protein, putative [Bodo saltans]|eukprot:CUG07988.1 leucine-rich repeat protein, putative [Bodo saltans]
MDIERLDAFRASAREALANDEHSEAIEVICEANGWTREEFVSGRQDFQFLELFLLQFPTIPQLRFFPSIVTLKLCHIGLQEIKYFEGLVHLEVLWLSENDIKKIEGLENCEKLKELYLHNNHIRKMEGLKRLKQLKTLWLCRNEIGAIEEMEYLPNLQSLWLAGNQITSLRNAFPQQSQNLQELNVACNKISSFRDIPILNDLKSLATVYFADPMYGDNPVCQLSNYQTFTLFHLPLVKTLDFVHISAEQRLLAESTFVKKKIYYSMRVHTIRRNLSLLLHAVNTLAGKKGMEAGSSMTVLERHARNLEQDVDEFEAYGTNTAPDMTFRTEAATNEARKLLQRVRHAISSRRRETDVVEHRRSEACRCMQTLTETYISRLMLELNTGGNVRLEEGKLKDVWFQSCGELLRTRFFSADFEAYGIKDIQVHRVTRIHNRGLRSCFDQALSQLVDLSDPSYKRALEYLFFALPHDSDIDLNDSIEHGFAGRVQHGTASSSFSSSPQTSSPSGSISSSCPVKGVPMTNSVFLAEHVRLQRAKEAGQLKVDDPSFSPEVFVGKVVVCKVFLGKCQAERGVPVEQQPLVIAPLAGQSGGGPSSPVKSGGGDYPAGTNSIYRCKPQDAKQRVWYSQSAELVLPEYVVEFVYTPADPMAQLPPAAEFGATVVAPDGDATQQFRKIFPNTSPVDIADFRAIGIHCLSFLGWCESSPYSAIATRDAAEVLANPIPTSTRPMVGGELLDSHLESYHELISSSSEEAKGGVNAHQPLTILNLHSRKIQQFKLSPALMSAMFSPLKELVLFDNGLTTFPWFELGGAAPLLDTIDVSYNQLQRLIDAGAASLPCLRTLLIDHNFLFCLEDVKALSAAAPKLQHLSVAHNPCIGEKRAAMYIASVLPKLELLSHVPISDVPELQRHRMTPKALDVGTLGYIIPAADKFAGGAILSDANVVTETSRHFACFNDAVHAYATETAQNSGIPPVPTVPSLAALSAATILALNRTQLDSVARIDALRRLVHVQLRSNHIHDMEPLMALTLVETLDLEDNRIRRMAGLASLVRLRRLDLSKNFIERVECLDTLKSLQYLSLSHNRLSSLAPLAPCTSLLELYCSSNMIATEKEALHLRDLPKLIILDLAGNPCASIDVYRSYVVFQVKRLKVLDGISIDAAEIQRSKDTFAGRISAELLRERLPAGTDWSLARELNLASCALKEITLLDAFTSLTHLKLEHNSLVNIDGLRCCVSLVALNLSHNKLGQCPVGRVFELMPNLESLSLESNGISSIAQLLLNSQRLKFLNLKSNEILKLDGLDRVGQLREILLDKNRLRAIDRDALLFVPYLRELYCEENAIKTIEGVHVAVQLQKVSFASNRISEVSDLGKNLEGLPITDICFLGNPVVRKAYYRNHLIHSLPNAQVVDNRVVTPEERERVESSYQQDTIPPNVFTDVRMPMQGGAPMVVPAPPQRIPLRVLSLEGEGGSVGVGPAGPGGPNPSSGNARGRPPQGVPIGNKGPVNGSAPRTSSADLRGNVVPVSSGPRISAPAPTLGKMMAGVTACVHRCAYADARRCAYGGPCTSPENTPQSPQS